MVEVPGARVPESGETEITSPHKGVVFVFHLEGRSSGIYQNGKYLKVIYSSLKYQQLEIPGI